MSTFQGDKIKNALDTVAAAVEQLGYARISPESLEALERTLPQQPPNVCAAFHNVMAGFRALLAPAE